MGLDDKTYRQRVRQAKFRSFLGRRAMRDTGLVDRLCRRFLERAARSDPKKSFMRDELIDSDTGYDAAELERYQRGEQS